MLPVGKRVNLDKTQARTPALPTERGTFVSLR